MVGNPEWAVRLCVQLMALIIRSCPPTPLFCERLPLAAEYNQTVSYVNSLRALGQQEGENETPAPSQESHLLCGSKGAGVNDTRWAEADSTGPELRVLLASWLPERFPNAHRETLQGTSGTIFESKQGREEVQLVKCGTLRKGLQP